MFPCLDLDSSPGPFLESSGFKFLKRFECRSASAHALAKFCAKTEMELGQAQFPISDSGPGPHLSELRTRSELTRFHACLW